MAEVSQAEKNVFGADARLHPVTGMVLESGKGALSDFHQALNHIQTIEASSGRAVANAMRRKLGVKTPEEIAEEARLAAEAEKEHHQKLAALEERIAKLEAHSVLSVSPLTASSEARGE